jgi:hypothetical protein
MMKLWQRGDPRIGPAPLRAARRVPRWVIEVLPDVFAPGAEALREQVIQTIAKVYESYTGRWLLRTAHPAEAVSALRALHENDRGGMRSEGARSEVPSRVVLAVYAETQAELDARVAELRAPRVRAERLALTDVEAAYALALKEGAVYKSDTEAEAARNVGPEALAALLSHRYAFGRRTMCIGPDTGGLALYLSPRETIDISRALVPPTYDRNGEVDHHPVEWVIAAGQVGPLGPEGAGPWPMHPQWITDLAVAARDAKVPFCVPHLGEWCCYDYRVWAGDHTVSGGMSSSEALERVPWRSVDFDPSWQWGERGWDRDNPGAKPSAAYMQAVGSKLVGRALCGRTFDEWPDRSWCER